MLLIAAEPGAALELWRMSGVEGSHGCIRARSGGGGRELHAGIKPWKGDASDEGCSSAAVASERVVRRDASCGDGLRACVRVRVCVCVYVPSVRLGSCDRAATATATGHSHGSVNCSCARRASLRSFRCAARASIVEGVRSLKGYQKEEKKQE